MIPLSATFSTATFFTTGRCPLECDFCHLWQNLNKIDHKIHDTEEQINQAIQQHTLSARLGTASVINIIGGDPLENPDILVIIQQLKTYRRYIRFWTTGIYPAEMLGALKPWLDEIMIYFPELDAEAYRQTTGYDHFDDLLHNLQYMNEIHLPVILNHPVRPGTLPVLPDFYEFSYRNQLPLLLHYEPGQFTIPQSVDYIRRWNAYPNILVLQSGLPHPEQCAAFPEPFIWKQPGFSGNLYQTAKFTLRNSPLFRTLMPFLP